MYRNSLTPAKLFAIVLLLLFLTGAALWLTCLIDPNEQAFDTDGLILLGLAFGSLILSLLFFRRVKWVRALLSVLLHLAGLALLVTLPYSVPNMETLLAKVTVVAFTMLGAGLLFVAILALHSTAMRVDFAPSQERVVGPHKPPYVKSVAAGLVLLLAIGAWQIVPLLIAHPTISVDYLVPANQANKPADYDPNRNAAPYYEKLLSQFTALPETLKGKFKSWPTDLSPDEYKVLEEWAPKNEFLLPVLAQAAQCPYWWYEMKSTNNALSGIQVYDRDPIRNCAWGVLVLAKYKASRGDPENGLRLLGDLHMLGVHQAQGGTLLEQLTGLAICGVSYNALLAVLDHGPVESGTLKRTLQTFASRLPGIVVPRFSEVEHLYGRDNLQRLFTDDEHGNGRLIPAQLYKIKQKTHGPYSHPISYLDAVRICLTHPDRQETLQLDEIYFTFVKELAKQTPWELFGRNTSYERTLERLLSGNYYLHDNLAATAQCIRVGWRARVSGDATVAILALFVYKVEEGRFPESLQQLADKGLIRSVPLDPYSGGPLIYKVEDDNFTLYSVGEDFVDSGGMPCEWDEKYGDHVFWPVPVAAP